MNTSPSPSSPSNSIEELLQRCFEASQVGDRDKLEVSADALGRLAIELDDERARTLSAFYFAHTFIIAGDSDQAFAGLQAVMPALEELGEVAFIARAKSDIGRIYIKRDQHELGMFYVLSALEQSISLQDPYGILRGISVLSLHGGDDPSASLEAITNAVDVLGQMGEYEAQVKALSQASIGASSVFSNAEAAIRFGSQAVEISRRINDLSSEARALDSLGGTYWTLGDAGRAAETLLEAVHIAEKSGNRQLCAQTLMNAAYAFIQLEDFEKVAELNRRGLAVFDQVEVSGSEKALVGWLELGLAHALLHLGEQGEAMQRATRAIELVSNTWDTHGLGYAYYRRGEIHAAVGELDAALIDFQQSLDLRIENNMALEIAESLCEIGKLLAMRREYEEALEVLQRALSKAEESSNNGVSSTTHIALADVFAGMGNHEEAYEHIKKHLDARAKIINQEASRRASGAEIRHQQELQQQEMDITESILNNVLPPAISKRLKTGERQIAETIPEVSVLFADIVGFTPLVAEVSADDLVNILAQVFGHFDAICAKHGLEKIKTIGDAYMAVAGAPEPVEDHALRCAAAALEMLNDFTMDATQFSDAVKGVELDFRIGIHCGSAVAGVIGEQRIAYDLWGDAVNVAARMESHGEAGKVHVSQDFARQLGKDLSRLDVPPAISIAERGILNVKGRGEMATYFLE